MDVGEGNASRTGSKVYEDNATGRGSGDAPKLTEQVDQEEKNSEGLSEFLQFDKDDAILVLSAIGFSYIFRWCVH